MAKFKTTSGNSVVKPFNKVWLIIGAVIILLIIFWQFITFDSRLFNMSQLVFILDKMFTPAGNDTWADYFGHMLNLGEPLLDTLKMSFAGTVIGSLLAIPIAVFAASNIFKLPIIHRTARFIMNLIRTVPAMVLALVAVFLVGIGVLAGIIAVILFTFGIMSKMLYEAIETVDMSAYEAMESTGANKSQALYYAIVPQILPVYISYLIYIFEINIRASAILGYVGAGGLGAVIKDNVLYNYDIVGATVILMLILILVVQFISNFIRSKLQ